MIKTIKRVSLLLVVDKKILGKILGKFISTTVVVLAASDTTWAAAVAQHAVSTTAATGTEISEFISISFILCSDVLVFKVLGVEVFRVECFMNFRIAVAPFHALLPPPAALYAVPFHPAAPWCRPHASFVDFDTLKVGAFEGTFPKEGDLVFEGVTVLVLEKLYVRSE